MDNQEFADVDLIEDDEEEMLEECDCEECSGDDSLELFFPPMSLKDLNIDYDADQFTKGLKEASYVAGLYTGLINCGMSIKDSKNYIFGLMNCKLNVDLAEITSKATVEASKNASVANEKQQI